MTANIVTDTNASPLADAAATPSTSASTSAWVTTPACTAAAPDIASIPPSRSASSGSTSALDPMSGSTVSPAASSWPLSRRPEKGFAHWASWNAR